MLAVEKGEEIVGGVALYEEDTPGGTRVSPRLLLYYNGPVLVGLDSRYPYRATSEHVRILGELQAWLSGAGYGRLTLKCPPGFQDVRALVSAGWAVRPTWSYVVPIADLDESWSRIEQNLRRLVRRAEKEGITATEDDDFESFFRLHASTMDRKDRGVYLGADRFERYYRALSEQGKATLFHARLADGTAVATALVLLGNHAGGPHGVGRGRPRAPVARHQPLPSLAELPGPSRAGVPRASTSRTRPSIPSRGSRASSEAIW